MSKCVAFYGRSIHIETEGSTGITWSWVNHAVKVCSTRVTCKDHACLAVLRKIVDMAVERHARTVGKLSLNRIEVIRDIVRSRGVIVHKPALGVTGIDLGGSVGNTKAAGIHSLGYQLLGELLFEF
ncbi:MAG: hypothetical protein HFJ63_00730 [Atopobiaceae bacterium]|nr:hypothetical protein [Atopobiaceae bacterium]